MKTGVVITGLLATVAVLAGCVGIDRRATTQAAKAEAEFPPLGQFVEVDGQRVHAYIEGTGPDLVILHGAGGNLRDYTFDFVDRVRDRYRVIVFDRPGHGYTEQTDPALDAAFSSAGDGPEAQAAFLHKAALQLGVENPIVMGQSFGGAVAMAWALNHDPAAVVMVSGVAHPWPGTLDWTYRIGGTSLGGGVVIPLVSAFPPDDVGDNLSRIFAPDPVPEGYAAHFGPALTLRRDTLRANTRQVNTLRPHIVEMAQRYPSLSLPIEAVHGTADIIVPMSIHAEPLAERVASANLVALPGHGHMPHHGDPEGVIAAIDRAAARAGLR